MEAREGVPIGWIAWPLICVAGVAVLTWWLVSPPGREEGVLAANLESLAGQVWLFAQEHGGCCPGVEEGGGFDGELFLRQLTDRTDANGTPYVLARRRARAGRRARFDFGPYCQRIPTNPFVSAPSPRLGRVRHGTISGGTGPPPADGSTDWYFDFAANRLYANDPEHRGVWTSTRGPS